MSAFKFGICQWAFPMPGPYALRTAAALGFAGMELDFGPYERSYPLSSRTIQRAYLDMAAETGISLPSMTVDHLNRFGLTRPMDSRAGMICTDGVKRGIEAAAAMQIPVVQLPSFNDGAIRTERDFYNTCEKLKLFCEIAAPCGITIASENALSAAETLRMVRQVGCENFKIMFDTQNYFLHGRQNAAAILRALHPHVAQIHLKDGYNGKLSGSLLGAGESGFFETAAVIRETRCAKWLLLENYYHTEPLCHLCADPFQIVKRDLAIARGTFE